jgi:predicted MPP superfamily phosphohydrolase
MQIFGIFLFLFLLVGILGGSHYVVYISLVKFLVIENNKGKIVLALTLCLLSVSFFLSSVFAHWSENSVTRGAYFISGIWLGLLANLVLLFGFLWFLKGMGWIDMSKTYLLAAIMVALVLSAYGIWNAFHPRIKNVVVSVKALPAAWKGRKIIQLTDVHLGHIYQKEFMQKVVNQVNEQEPYLVVITGDLFDGMDGALGAHIEPLSQLTAPAGVLYITGNHETYLGVDKVLEVLSKSPVQVMSDESVEIEGVQFVGVSYPLRGEHLDLTQKIASLKEDDEQKPVVLLYHSPNDIEAAKKNGVALQLSGHTHRGQLFPFGLITRLIFHGYDYGLKQEGDFNLYTSSGVGTWGPAMRTSQAPEIVVIELQ